MAFKKFIIFLMAWGVTTAHAVTFSKATVSPQDKNLLLLNQGSHTYLIQNISKQSVWIDHPTKNRSASAGWASFIQPGHWSAINLDKKNFLISCSQIKPGEVIYLSCDKTIAIYVYPFPPKKSGTYWIAEDQSYESLLKILPLHGKN